MYRALLRRFACQSLPLIAAAVVGAYATLHEGRCLSALHAADVAAAGALSRAVVVFLVFSQGLLGFSVTVVASASRDHSRIRGQVLWLGLAAGFWVASLAIQLRLVEDWTGVPVASHAPGYLWYTLLAS